MQIYEIYDIPGCQWIFMTEQAIFSPIQNEASTDRKRSAAWYD